MPSLAMYRISPPTDYSEFEKICMDYLSNKYDADASLYGRRGQKQQGIDIVVTLKDSSYICAQCKDTDDISTSLIDVWIHNAEECKIPMKEFVIMVAADNDAKIQEYICLVATQRIKEGKAPVRLLFWDDIVHYIKKDQTMLRLYYPEFYSAENVSLIEATQKLEDNTSFMICSEEKLVHHFFEKAVKYNIELFLNSSPIEGFSFDLIGCSEAFRYAVKRLMYQSPLLTAENAYYRIDKFADAFNEYCEFLPNTTEVISGVKVIAINRYHTIEENNDIQHAEDLRKSAAELYNEIKVI